MDALAHQQTILKSLIDAAIMQKKLMKSSRFEIHAQLTMATISNNMLVMSSIHHNSISPGV